MAQMSRRFNFDEFDQQIAEALEEHELSREELDRRMAEEDAAWELEERWADHDRVFYPGEIGGVLCRPSFTIDSLPEPPEVA